MTQELVLGVLLAGFVGLVWAMTVSVLWTDREPQASKEPRSAASSQQNDDAKIDQRAAEHQTVAA